MTDLQRETAALLRALGAGLDVALDPDEAAACGLRVDDRLDLALGCDERRAAVVASARVGELPANAPEAALRRLLAANHGADADVDTVWSLSGDTVVLTRRFPLVELDAQVLATALSELVAQAFEEQDALSAAPAAAEPSPTLFGLVTA